MKTPPTQIDLKKYSVYAIAFLSSSNAIAQIVYTDVNPDALLNPGTNLMDMDNDGEADYNIDIFDLGSFDGVLISGEYYDNYIAGSINSAAGPFGIYASALNTNDEVGALLNWMNDGYLYWSLSAGGLQGGQWQDISNKYLGVKFNIDGNYHFGWIRMNVSTSPISVTVRDYAYHATANTPLAAVKPNAIDQLNTFIPTININDKNLVIQLPNGITNCNIRIFNLIGQEMINVKDVVSNEEISLQDLLIGTYLLNINSAENNYSCMVNIR